MAKAIAKTADFGTEIATAYATKGNALQLGRGVHQGELSQDAVVQVPLRMLNRHGLIAARPARGRTLQLIAEQLSAAGVPTFLADVKGDVSGMAEPGGAEGVAAKRMAELGLTTSPRLPGRAVLARRLGPGSRSAPRSRTSAPAPRQDPRRQRDAGAEPLTALPLRRRERARSRRPRRSPCAAPFFDSDEGKDALKGLGGVSGATIGVLLRALVSLEDGGGTEFFGEPQLEIDDLLRTAPDGRGIVSCLELPAVQDKPTLWSTALMWLLAELFEELPEVGDLDKPKLVFFFDEAHLLFEDATPAFLDAVVRTVRLIRSKGIGVFFVTQSPTDLPRDVLGQLGNRVQHALRAFTPRTRRRCARRCGRSPSPTSTTSRSCSPSSRSARPPSRSSTSRACRPRRAHAARGAQASMSPRRLTARAGGESTFQDKYGTRAERRAPASCWAAHGGLGARAARPRRPGQGGGGAPSPPASSRRGLPDRQPGARPPELHARARRSARRSCAGSSGC